MRDHHRKGVADISHAFKLVLEDHPKTYLYLVGDGPSRAEYQALAAVVFELGGRAIFVGHLIDPRPYMSAADIFVLASHFDPGPLVVAEARHAGCAIVATEVDGIPEMLDDGLSGLLVPPRQPEIMARALKQLLSDPLEIERYAAHAKRNVEQFTVERVCRDMERVYAEILVREAS